MGISDEVQNLRQALRQTFDAERLKTIWKEIEAIKVKYEQEISDHKKEMEKKDELQRELEKTLNEVKLELEEQKEQNRQSKAEIQTSGVIIKANNSYQDQLIEENSKKTKEILRLEKEGEVLSSKLNTLMNDKEEIDKSKSLVWRIKVHLTIQITRWTEIRQFADCKQP